MPSRSNWRGRRGARRKSEETSNRRRGECCFRAKPLIKRVSVCVCVCWGSIRSGLLLCKGNGKAYNPVRGKGGLTVWWVFRPQPYSRPAQRSLNPLLLLLLPPCFLAYPPTSTHHFPSASSPPPLPPVGEDY